MPKKKKTTTECDIQWQKTTECLPTEDGNYITLYKNGKNKYIHAFNFTLDLSQLDERYSKSSGFYEKTDKGIKLINTVESWLPNKK